MTKLFKKNVIPPIHRVEITESQLKQILIKYLESEGLIVPKKSRLLYIERSYFESYVVLNWDGETNEQ